MCIVFLGYSAIPHALEPMLCHKRSHHNEKAVHCDCREASQDFS